MFSEAVIEFNVKCFMYDLCSLKFIGAHKTKMLFNLLSYQQLVTIKYIINVPLKAVAE